MIIRVAIVSLNSKRYNQTFFDCYEPLALPVLNGHLLHKFGKNVEVANIDMQHEEYGTPDKVFNFLLQLKSDIIGLSVPWGTLNELDCLISNIFKENNDFNWRPTVVLGKQLPSNFSEVIPNRYKKFPILIAVGSGEFMLEDIVNYRRRIKGTEEIRNVVYKKGNKLICGDVASPFIVEAPAIHEEINRYNIIGLQSSSGCSWAKCSFCLRAKDSSGCVQAWVPVGVPIVISEMIELSSKGVRGINIVDEDFAGGLSGISHIKQLINEIERSKEKGRINKSFLFSASIRADEILIMEKAGLLKSLKENGLRFVFIGVESGSDAQLKRYNKGINAKIIKKSIRLLCKYNIFFEAGFILFDPFVTLKELKENISLMEWELGGGSVFVDFIANPLNKGRVFYKSPLYFQLFEKHRELLRELDINRGQYDYHFMNPGIQEIVNMIGKWYPDDFHNTFVKPIRHIIMHSIHNFQDISAYNNLQKYIVGFRRLELKFLKEVIGLREKRLSSAQINESLRRLDKERDNYIANIKVDELSLPEIYRKAIREIVNNIKPV